MASAMDKITMQNVDSTLAKWSPDSPCHLHAIVDMGRFVKPVDAVWSYPLVWSLVP